MRALIQAAAILGAVASPAAAQDAPADVDTMTCGDFLALGAEEQMGAMLALRAAYNGEPLEEPAPAAGEEAVAGTDGAEAGTGDAAATNPRLTGMRTSCEGVPDLPALDALVAAHADYE